jgi:hypothetical protein
MEAIINFLSVFVVGVACFDLIKAIINKNGIGDAYLSFLTFVPTLCSAMLLGRLDKLSGRRCCCSCSRLCITPNFMQSFGNPLSRTVNQKIVHEKGTL